VLYNKYLNDKYIEISFAGLIHLQTVLRHHQLYLIEQNNRTSDEDELIKEIERTLTPNPTLLAAVAPRRKIRNGPANNPGKIALSYSQLATLDYLVKNANRQAQVIMDIRDYVRITNILSSNIGQKDSQDMSDEGFAAFEIYASCLLQDTQFITSPTSILTYQLFLAGNGSDVLQVPPPSSSATLDEDDDDIALNSVFNSFTTDLGVIDESKLVRCLNREKEFDQAILAAEVCTNLHDLCRIEKKDPKLSFTSVFKQDNVDDQIVARMIVAQRNAFAHGNTLKTEWTVGREQEFFENVLEPAVRLAYKKFPPKGFGTQRPPGIDYLLLSARRILERLIQTKQRVDTRSINSTSDPNALFHQDKFSQYSKY
jgi:hypothetical protein